MVIGYIKKVLVGPNPKKCCLHSTLYFVTAKPGGVGEGGQGIGMAPRGLLRARVTIANYHQINCNTEGMDMEDVKIIRKQDHLRVHKIKQSP